MTGIMQSFTNNVIPNYVVSSGLQVQLTPNSYSGSGTTWTDVQGNANATLTGTPTYNSSTGFTFNGTSQYARIPSTAGVTDFTNTNNYTVEVWFNPTAGQPNASLATVFEKWNQNNQAAYPYALRYVESSGTMQFPVYDGTNNPSPTMSGFTTGNWWQAVGTWNFSTRIATPYRNGVIGTAVSLTGVNAVSNTSQVGVAHRISTAGVAQFLFKGGIGVIRIYNKALTQAEIIQNFYATKGLFGL